MKHAEGTLMCDQIVLRCYYDAAEQDVSVLIPGAGTIEFASGLTACATGRCPEILAGSYYDCSSFLQDEHLCFTYVVMATY